MTEDRELKAMEVALKTLQPLGPEERQRVLDWLMAKLELQSVQAPPGDPGGKGGSSAESDDGLGSIKQFLKQKSTGDDVARATTLAYYLTHMMSQSTYKTADLTKARVDAALSNFNMSRAVSNAQRSGYLTTAGRRGTYQVTSTGEALVEAMPDEKAIKEVKGGTRRRRKSTGAKRKAATKKK